MSPTPKPMRPLTLSDLVSYDPCGTAIHECAKSGKEAVVAELCATAELGVYQVEAYTRLLPQFKNRAILQHNAAMHAIKKQLLLDLEGVSRCWACDRLWFGKGFSCGCQ